MEMRKLLGTCFMLLAFAGMAQPQVVGGKFDKLLDLYAMERYEDCAWKAEKLSANDKYRREPEPYLYMAMCMYQIHMNKDEYDEEIYKDPLKDAMKYAYKFRKKDKDKAYFDNNEEFLLELKREGLNQARYWMKDNNYRKASSVYARILKFNPEDTGVRYIVGVTKILARETGPGTLEIKAAMTEFNTGLAEGSFEVDPITKDDLVNSFVKYTDYLKENNQLDSAQTTIAFAQKLIENDLDLANQSKKLNRN